MDHEVYTPGSVDKKVIHNEITADVLVANAKVQPCAGAKSIALTFAEEGTVNNRSGVLKVYGSVDGVKFDQINMLISNLANTNGETITRVAMPSLPTAMVVVTLALALKP